MATANVPCDANSLSSAASCFDCGIPLGLQQAIIIYLLCFIANNPSSGGGTGENVFTSALTPFVAGTTKYVFAHGLPVAPNLWKTSLQCVANDANTGAVIGQKLPAEFWIDSFSGNSQAAFMVKADAANITVSTNDDYAGGGFGALQLVTDL